MERNVYWIAYVTLGLAVGAIVGYVKGHKQGYVEGYDKGLIKGDADRSEIQRKRHRERGLKASQTRLANQVRDAQMERL